MGSRSLELCYLTLHTRLEDAKEIGLVMENVVARVPKPKHEPKAARDWAMDDMRVFLRAAIEDGSPLSLGLALLLLFWPPTRLYVRSQRGGRGVGG